MKLLRMNCVLYGIGNIMEPLGMIRVKYSIGGNIVEPPGMEHVIYCRGHNIWSCFHVLLFTTLPHVLCNVYLPCTMVPVSPAVVSGNK